MKSSDEKLPVLDGLRAISILLVLACHLLPLGPKALKLNETAGAMGMSLFFALSGFLITSGLVKNPRVDEFLVRRLARILPLAYAYTFVVLLVFSLNPKALLWTDLFVVNYFPQYLDTGWTNHFWSLCVEMQFYLAIAIVILVAGRKGTLLVWPTCLIVTLLRVEAGAYIDIVTHLRVDEILSGACIATISRRNLFGASFSLMVLAALLWAISAWPLAGDFQYLRPYTTGFLLLTALSYGRTNSATMLSSRPMRYIAGISYALYVIHPATAHGWMDEGSMITKYLVKRPISIVLTFLLAHFSTFYWESRWQSAARLWLKRRSSNSAEDDVTPVKPVL